MTRKHMKLKFHQNSIKNVFLILKNNGEIVI